MANVDLDLLERALKQLRTSLNYHASCSDPELAPVFRSAAIQGFEFTFELSHKTLRRYLAHSAPSSGPIMELAFPHLIRKGYARGLLTREWKDWHAFRRLRNLTSHAYSEAYAAEVFAGIPAFVDEISKMLKAIAEEAASL